MNQAQDTTLLALRRRFLIDLAWPMMTTDLADMFGLPPTSEDVAAKEVAESHVLLKELVAVVPAEYIIGPASDMAKLLASMQTVDEDTLTAWLLSYSLALISMIRSFDE